MQPTPLPAKRTWPLRPGLTLLLGTLMHTAPLLGSDTLLATASPTRQLHAWRKLSCSLKDGDPVRFVGEGTVWSRIPGEKDRLLFRTVALFSRTAETLKDPKDPHREGFRILNRELLLFLDPATGKVLKLWANPFNGQTVEVVPVANDPVNQRPAWNWEVRDGKQVPFQFPGRMTPHVALASFQIPIHQPSDIPARFPEFGGGQTYQAAELFTFMGTPSALLDDTKPVDPTAHIAWTRISPWMPWMRMGNRPGCVYMTLSAWMIPDLDTLPLPLKDHLQSRPEHRLFLTPPPLGDTRENQTSWRTFADTLPKP